jgi:hypothetical protein
MASILNASLSSGLIATGDTSGIIQLQSNGTTLATFAPTGITSGVGSFPAMTLLGTLTTTSGTTQTLSGLTLTNYKYLQISINNVSGNATGYLRMAGLNITGSTSTAAQAQWGILQVDLTNNGAFNAGLIYDVAVTSGTSASIGYVCAGNCGYTTATTSISFDYSSAATFDSGTIKVYGVA